VVPSVAYKAQKLKFCGATDGTSFKNFLKKPFLRNNIVNLGWGNQNEGRKRGK